MKTQILIKNFFKFNKIKIHSKFIQNYSKIPLKSIKTRLINISKNFFSIVFLKNIHFPQFIHKC